MDLFSHICITRRTDIIWLREVLSRFSVALGLARIGAGVCALKERRRNPNGYAALLGRALDAVCTDRGIPSHKPDGRPIFLRNRLAMLVAQEGLAKVEGVTGLRNIAAHADLGGLVPEDIPYLEALIRYILDHLYVIPAINQRAVATQKARRSVTSGL